MSIKLIEVGLVHQGPTMTLDVAAGQTLCIVGPAASGKSKLLRIIQGLETPDRGRVQRTLKTAAPQAGNRKLRPQDLSHRKGMGQAAFGTEVLLHLGLWEQRKRLVSELAPSQVVACDLVPLFLGPPSLAALDGELDLLDPWARAGALRLMRERCRHGASFAVVTNNLDMVDQFDHLAVLRDHQAVYCGSVADLASARGQRSLTVESERNRGVRALVDPLTVRVEHTDEGYRFAPPPGQSAVAKLLREGYGDVRFLVADERPIAEIVASLISTD